MSPSPALSKPPPQLSQLMNPLPDPPDPDDQMDMPEIYKGEPKLTQQGTAALSTSEDTMNKKQQEMENVKKQSHNELRLVNPSPKTLDY
ncbi:hypothetical protein O181_011305 [Austropuccinia psidii MF-1]|uniref:Uncharacterized protein n=1 Tax=Austropuccinia psidii MF-1 TaxID=1389203 RepID=A0A9Q3BUW5_9BASI|nr:hypothetical protein [Austropuccinia psidii MF-1]